MAKVLGNVKLRFLSQVVKEPISFVYYSTYTGKLSSGYYKILYTQHSLVPVTESIMVA